MDPTVTTYAVYLVLSIGLTVWVAHTLFKNGRRFLLDVFPDEDLADSVNHLLVVGFYLINLGYVSLALRMESAVADVRESIESLSWKVGLVLVVLGGMHFGNLYVFSRMRARSRPKPPRPDRVALAMGQADPSAGPAYPGASYPVVREEEEELR